MEKARVTTEYKGAYKVKNENGEFLARVTGKQMFDAQGREDFPAVGDWVLIDELPENQAVIKEILPRRGVIKRKHKDKSRIGGKNETQMIAVNIDTAFVVQAVGRDFNLNRFERYFAIAEDGGVKPAIILNKIDLILKEEVDEKLAQIRNRFPDVDVIFTSTIKNEGLDELKNYIKKDKTYCFLGSSGVGKSSLINKLLGQETIKTEQISDYSNRGKHVTTGRQMYFLPNGGIVIDNPGMREVGMTDIGEGVDSFFDEISSLSGKCKYADCTHTHEKGCAVLQAVENKEIDRDQYQNYVNLKKESEYYQMSENEKKEKDRSFGKFLKNAKKQFEKYK